MAAPAVKMGLARTVARTENRVRIFVNRTPLGVLWIVLNFMVN